MATLKQITANQINALKSTGPKISGGKNDCLPQFHPAWILFDLGAFARPQVNVRLEYDATKLAPIWEAG